MDNRATAKLITRITPEQRARLKTLCAYYGLTQQDLILELVETWMRINNVEPSA